MYSNISNDEISLKVSTEEEAIYWLGEYIKKRPANKYKTGLELFENDIEDQIVALILVNKEPIGIVTFIHYDGATSVEYIYISTPGCGIASRVYKMLNVVRIVIDLEGLYWDKDKFIKIGFKYWSIFPDNKIGIFNEQHHTTQPLKKITPTKILEAIKGIKGSTPTSAQVRAFVIFLKGMRK